MTTTFSQQITSAGADAAIRWATMRRLEQQEQQERRDAAAQFSGQDRRASQVGSYMLAAQRGCVLHTIEAQRGASEPMMHVIEVRS